MDDKPTTSQDWGLFAALVLMGSLGAFLHVRFPPGGPSAEWRWAVGFLGFALLPNWRMAGLLAVLLSMFPLARGAVQVDFLGNLLYAIPCLVLLRWTYRHRLSNAMGPLTRGAGWFLLVLLCYQVFLTPAFARMAWAAQNERTLAASLLRQWRLQPLLFQSLIVAVASTLFLLARQRYHRIDEVRRQTPQQAALRLVETLPHPVGFLSADYRFLALNSAFADLFETRPETLVGQSIASLVGEKAFRTTLRARLDRCLEGNAERHDARLSLPRKDPCWMEIEYYPFKAKNGAVEGIAIHALDITEGRKAVEELSAAERWYRTLFETTETGVLIMTQGAIADCNGAALNVLGCAEKEQACGRGMMAFSPEEQPDGRTSLGLEVTRRQEALKGSVQSFPWRVLRHDGTTADCDVVLDRVWMQGHWHLRASMRPRTVRRPEERSGM